MNSDTAPVLLVALLIVVAIVSALFKDTSRPRRSRKGRWYEEGDGLRKAYESEGYPYRARRGLLTPTELDFYQVLRQTVGSRATICPVVRLGDIVEVDTIRTKYEQSHGNRINRKHIDFVLCEPATMKPFAGIELDDRSHERADRQERDQFVDAVFATIGLPLIRFPASRQYARETVAASLAPYLGVSQQPPNSPARSEDSSSAKPKIAPIAQAPRCAKCGSAMIIRTIQKGEHAGERFWGCSSYPDCRHRMPV